MAIPYTNDRTALGSLSITEGVNILGTGADLLTILQNNTYAFESVFITTSNDTVNLSGMTIKGAKSDGIFIMGDLAIDGCVISENGNSGVNHFGGTLTINNSTISQNTGWLGGGISNIGELTLTNSTISNNTSLLRGGGI